MKQGNAHFECVVIETYQCRDMGYGEVNKDESRLVTGVDLNDLYEKLGEAKSKETPLEVRGRYYTTVEFGTIREIVVVSETVVYDEMLRATSAWQKQVQKQVQQREADALRKQRALAALEAEKEARERAEYLRLRAKFSSKTS